MPQYDPDPLNVDDLHVPQSMFRKGSLIAGRSDGEPEEVPPGTTGQVPTTQSNGTVRFATPAGGEDARLPDPSAASNGQVLTVEDGAYSIEDAAGGGGFTLDGQETGFGYNTQDATYAQTSDPVDWVTVGEDLQSITIAPGLYNFAIDAITTGSGPWSAYIAPLSATIGQRSGSSVELLANGTVYFTAPNTINSIHNSGDFDSDLITLNIQRIGG